ncbi:MAG: T9SS type A sorting domain-containing protein, partial [Bacteroidia bacterium]|nr:T9SS type A sorting domain-containing protein [Bacteroidia bacterium]
LSRTGLDSLSVELGIGGDQSENPLPVKLTNLSAKLLTNQSTLINWQTSFEYNSNKFIVQRSLDKNKWINRGEIKSKGNSTTTQNYSFIDDVNGLSIVIYYRLLQVDMDGTITTSKIVSVQPTKQTIVTLQVYPNPTSDKFRVTGLNNKAMLFDITGKQQLEILADGEINIAHLPAGMYFLRTDNEAIKIVKK